MKKLMNTILVLSLILFSFTACNKVNTQETNASPEGTMSEIIDKIYEQKEIALKVETQEIDLTDLNQLNYYTGLNEATKIKEAAVSEAMITSQAYSMVLVRVNDKADTKQVAEEMLNGINQNKWICVGADDLKVATCGDTIMLIMVSTTLSDTVTADQMVDVFKTVSGGNTDQILTKE
jgi:hypothetical protein